MAVNSSRSGDRVFITRRFGPFYRKDSRILILGSFPSPKSREANFFYGHPQNRFWAVIAALFEQEIPETLSEKQALLIQSKIALYDVIESCSIIGASDNSIADVVPTDLASLLHECDIGNRIYANGGKAFELYMKYQFLSTGIPAVKLPSTSPANAAFSKEKLIQIWRQLLFSAPDP